MVAKNLLKNTLVLIGAVLLCFSVAEIFVRIIESDVKIIDKKWFKENVQINSLGLRDREFSFNKPKNTFRILILGDSQTLGHGIDRLEDTYPKKLEKKLNQKSSSIHFEVINASDSGWNTDTQLYKFLEYGLKLDPDLVVLAYYLNDIPWPHEVQCSGRDIFYTPGVSIWGDMVFWSRAIKFFKFRKNRLLEKFSEKISVPDCFNLVYDTRAWEMEKVYLDFTLMAAQVKQIHFMISLIPVMFSLNDEFPFKKIHTKLNDYCSEKNIECLDLFESTFKRADASSLVVSKYDRHLNAKAAEMVSDGLFAKLKKLTEYKNLSKYHRGFSLKDLIQPENNIITRLDSKFEQLEKVEKSIYAQEKNRNWELKRQLNSSLSIKEWSTDVNSKEVKHESVASLNEDGKLFQFRAKYFDERDKSVRREILDVLEDRSNFSVFSNGKGIGTDIFLMESQEIRDRQILRITEQTTFIDPKAIEKSLFGVNDKNILGPEAEGTIYAALEFYYKGLGFGKWNWKKYALALSSEIEREKPSIAALKAVGRFYSQNGLFKRLKNLKEANPKLGFLLRKSFGFPEKLNSQNNP